MSIRSMLIYLLFAICASAEPDLPRDGFIVFASNRTGSWRIWRMNVDGSGQQQLTGNAHEAVMPTISPDGRWVAYKEGRNHEASAIWIIPSDGTGAAFRAVDQSDNTGVPVAPAWGTNGFYYSSNRLLYLYDPSAKSARPVWNLSDFTGLQGKQFDFHSVTSDSRWILGRVNERGGTVILNTVSRGDVWFFGPGCEATAPPRGPFLFHIGNSHAPNSNRDGCDIMRMDTAEITMDPTRRSTYMMELGYREKDWGHEYWPRISNDNQWLVYGASTGAHDHYGAQYELFIHKIGMEGHRHKLTSNTSVENWPHLWIGKGKTAARAAREKQAIHLRINAGGGSVEGWTSDIPYADRKSGTYSTPHQIAIAGVQNSAPESVYRTCRHLDPVFTFPAHEIPNGDYIVRLHMAEPHFDKCEDAQRRMTISIQGQPIARDFDPCKAAGVCRKAYVIASPVRVRGDSGLTITFDGRGRDGFVMGIEILSQEPSATRRPH